MNHFNCFNRRMTWSFLRHQKISIIATWLQRITNLQLVFSRKIENTQKKIFALCSGGDFAAVSAMSITDDLCHKGK